LPQKTLQKLFIKFTSLWLYEQQDAQVVFNTRNSLKHKVFERAKLRCCLVKKIFSFAIVRVSNAAQLMCADINR